MGGAEDAQRSVRGENANGMALPRLCGGGVGGMPCQAIHSVGVKSRVKSSL